MDVLYIHIPRNRLEVCHGLTWQWATKTRNPLVHPSPSLSVGWGGEWTKSKTCGLIEKVE